jgi:hypothetical protein
MHILLQFLMVVLRLDPMLYDIKAQLNHMLYLNIMSYSVLSGCGTYSMPQHWDIELIEQFLDPIDTEKRPYNISFLNSLYKKALPQYKGEIENPYNWEFFKWVDKKQKRTIDPEVMASSVISCCHLAEKLLLCELNIDHPRFITYILLKTAHNQASFVIKHLKAGELFYSGEHVSQEDGMEAELQISSKSPDLLSQFAVFHAFAELIRLSSYNVFPSGFSLEEFDSCMELFPNHLFLLDREMEDISSRDLALLGLHLAGIYKSGDMYWEPCRKTLIQLARTLIHRVTSSGQVHRTHHSEETSSPYTSANCLNFLSQAAYILNSKSCTKAAASIYQKYCKLWESKHKLFLMKDSNKQSYNFKDISSILAALFSFQLIATEKSVKKQVHSQVSGFFEAGYIKSGIFNGQSSGILQPQLQLHNKHIKGDPKWAPVFNKGFEYKLSKEKYYCEADVFRADYILPACVILLGSIST